MAIIKNKILKDNNNEAYDYHNKYWPVKFVTLFNSMIEYCLFYFFIFDLECKVVKCVISLFTIKLFFNSMELKFETCKKHYFNFIV